MGKILYPDGTIGAAPREHVFLAGTQKSGGVHISNCLGLILGWRRSSLCSWQQAGLEEHDINPHVAGTILPQGAFVFHQHMRAWPANLTLLEAFKVKPIVLTRNAADVIVAVRDNCLKDYQEEFDPKGLPGVYIPGSFNELDREQQDLFLVENLGPWLLSFYVSWHRQTTVPCLFISYETHFQDQVPSFRRMLEWVGHGEGYPEAGIERVANMKPHNFNVGKVGRGKSLSPKALGRLDSMTDNWGPEWGRKLRRDLLSW